jgi:hypothetical protein
MSMLKPGTYTVRVIGQEKTETHGILVEKYKSDLKNIDKQSLHFHACKRWPVKTDHLLFIKSA